MVLILGALRIMQRDRSVNRRSGFIGKLGYRPSSCNYAHEWRVQSSDGAEPK